MTDSFISPKARLGHNVRVGHGTSVGDNVELDDNCQIGDHCTIGQPAGGAWAGKPLKLGAGSHIRSHTVIYEGAELGPDTQTGHHVLIREGTVAGENLRVGSFSAIEGDCRIGDCGRFHGYTHVGRGSKIGHFVHLYSLSILLNDPLPPSEILEPSTLEDGVVVAVGATVMPGSWLRRGAFASARSAVAGEIPPGAVIEGPQGQIVAHVTNLVNFKHGLRHPWMPNFKDRYPTHMQERLRQLQAQIVADRPAFMKTYLAKGSAHVTR
jgi:acetyltransferase-like isoleucine patch superfamily enzyme